MTEKHDPALKPDTVLTHAGRDPGANRGYVNTPVYRGSTIVFPTLDALEDPTPRYDYGRTGNPSSAAVEDIVTELEGAAGTLLAPSGLSAISLALMTLLKAGDELLLSDSAYHPPRRVSDGVLSRFGVAVRYYDPRLGARIADLFTDKTRAIFAESPGSLTFEVQDLPAIAAAARPRGIAVVVDNSWATPLFYRPLALGADVVVHAGTKMFVGHSDTMIGTASATPQWIKALKDTHLRLGLCASPDDCFITARGLRTLGVRMREHSAHSTEIAAWLEKQPGVARVIHPALLSHPDHAIWKRDFTGAGSVFSIELEPKTRTALAAMVDHLELFGMGWSWGGYESLDLPIHPEKARSATKWSAAGPMLRLHIGLEAVEDIKADLAAGLARYRAV